LFLCIFVTSAYAQNRTITGNVKDDEGLPLPGVSVIAEGDEFTGTITDGNGDYSIVVKPEINNLKFSFIGMKTETVVIGSQLKIDLILTSELKGIEEVVVIGYGTQKKSDIISSVVTVKAESLTKVPTVDVGEMLRGKAPGVFVSLSDASPGGSSNILIRGNNSIGGGNNPIIIADGVPVGNINDINPNDIASLEVLKDAAAQAIYGARASNGVILITTKRAATGKTKVNYNGYYGIQKVQRNFDVYNGEEFAQLRREAVRTDNNNTYLPDEDIFTDIEYDVLQSGEFIDWEKEVLQTAPINNHNLSFSTGTEATKVFSSFNFMDQEGVVPGTDYQKLTIRLNVDQKITNWMALGMNTSLQNSKNNSPGTGGTLQRTITTSPLGKIYNDDGSYRLNPTGVQESFNPLLDIAETSNLKDERNDIMNVFLDITPFKGFKYRINASRLSWNYKATNYSSTESLAGIQNNGQGQGQIQFKDNVEWQLENIFTYDTKINAHNLGFTFVNSTSEKKYSDFTNRATNIPNDIIGIYGLESAFSNTPTINATRRALASFVFRAQYDYNSKYYLT
jgi:TonB-linked SusC/RagA family outer membrane protein